MVLPEQLSDDSCRRVPWSAYIGVYQYPAVKLVTSPSPYSRIGDMVEIDYSYWEPYDVATQGGP
jgi:hypothetical protein